MRARADVVFPVLVPTLTKQPIGVFNARALSALVSVAGHALDSVLTDITGALSFALEVGKDESSRQAVDSAVESILGAVATEEGLHQLMMQLLGWAGHPSSAPKRVMGCRFIAVFARVKKGSLSLEDYFVDWIRRLVTLLADPAPDVVDAALPALDALFKTVPKDDMETYVVPLRRAVENLSAPGEEVAGFCRPKGIGAIVPVFLAGLMNGTAEQREQGAYGLADLVERTSAEAVKPFVIQTVGPLIRACGDRHAPPVKVAILSALTSTLQRVPQHCRPFYPQLQRSFQKAVLDPSSATVRSRAAAGLGVLMAHQPRVEPVLLELSQAVSSGLSGGEGAEVSALAESAALALVHVLDKAPSKNVTEVALQAAIATVREAFANSRDSIKPVIADVLAACAVHSGDSAKELLREAVLASPNQDDQLSSHCIRATMERSPAQLYTAVPPKDVLKAVLTWIGMAPAISRPAREARDLIKTKEPWTSDEFVREHV